MSPITKLNKYMKLAGGWDIARRYFVLNGFDGILTIFGIALGMYLEEIDSPQLILASGISASIAIGISGFWIAFLTEEAEQAKEKKELEETLLADLDESVFSRAARIAAFVNSFVDGLSPFMFGVIVLSPFIFARYDLLAMDTAYVTSFVVSGILLFILGMFLGSLSKQSMIIFGAKALLAGFVVTLLIILSGGSP